MNYGTKGKSVSELKDDTLWWHGLTWFILPPDQWPCVNDPPPIDNETLQQLGSDKKGSDVCTKLQLNVGAEGVSVLLFSALIFSFDLLRVIYGLFIHGR